MPDEVDFVKGAIMYKAIALTNFLEAQRIAHNNLKEVNGKTFDWNGKEIKPLTKRRGRPPLKRKAK